MAILVQFPRFYRRLQCNFNLLLWTVVAMATTDVSAAAILQAVQQNAQAAAAAAQALKEANERRTNGFGEANKDV